MYYQHFHHSMKYIWYSPLKSKYPLSDGSPVINLIMNNSIIVNFLLKFCLSKEHWYGRPFIYYHYLHLDYFIFNPFPAINDSRHLLYYLFCTSEAYIANNMDPYQTVQGSYCLLP